MNRLTLPTAIKNLYSLAALSLLAMLPGCASKSYESIKWQAAEVKADGEPTEWAIPLRHYDPISRLNYDFSNDRKNLYVIFRVSDQAAQMRLTQAGMEIALDTTGGKKFPVTLNYPLPSAAAPEAIPETSGSHDDSGAGRKTMRKNVIATQDHVLLGGFKNIPNGLAPITNDYGIKVGLNWDKDGTLYYEAVIPFKTFYKEALTAKDTLKPFTFRVTLDIIPGVENSDLAQDGSNSGGSHHRSGGGGGMGGMGGGLGGQGGGGMNGGMTGTMPPPGAGAKANGPEKSTIEFKMKLSLK